MSVLNNDYLPTIPSNISNERKIDLLEKYLIQLWQRSIDDRTTIAEIKKLVDADMPSSRIVALMREGLEKCVTQSEFKQFKASL
jgi:hypothetical protein